MQNLQHLAWLHWDPPKEAFTIPILDIPVMWYGIIFALGFVLGYFILIPIVKKLIIDKKTVYNRDILNWPLLISQLKSQASRFPKFPDIKPDVEPTAGVKESVLAAINTALKDPISGIDRQSLADLFPGSIAKVRDISVMFADRVTWFIVIGTILGARLGHVLFYDWPYYSTHPLEILMIRKGGLASHGGTVGVMISLLFFLRWYRKQFPEASLLMLMDVLVIPTSVAVCFIRIANFFNQEILGYETTLPWGVIFGHPSDGSNLVPRHPAQLYEAAAYLGTFVILYALWKRWGTALKPGILSGIFFILVFGSRFFLEFLKTEQTSWMQDSVLQMGQILSIPFILLGLVLVFRPIGSLSRS